MKTGRSQEDASTGASSPSIYSEVSPLDMSIAEAMVQLATSRPSSMNLGFSTHRVAAAGNQIITEHPLILFPCSSANMSLQRQGQLVDSCLTQFMNFDSIQNGEQTNDSELSAVPLKIESEDTQFSSQPEDSQSATDEAISNEQYVFPCISNTTIPSTSSSADVMKTLLQSTQDLKAEFENYIKKSQAELKISEETIESLRENVGSYQNQLEELRLEKEGYIARGSQVFQNLKEDLQKLLLKVVLAIESFGEPESMLDLQDCLHQEQNKSSKENSSLASLKSLENKIISLERNMENLMSTCHVIQENLQSQTASTSKKLDTILEFIVRKEGGNLNQPSVIIQQSEKSTLSELPSANNNVETFSQLENNDPLSSGSSQSLGSTNEFNTTETIDSSTMSSTSVEESGNISALHKDNSEGGFLGLNDVRLSKSIFEVSENNDSSPKTEVLPEKRRKSTPSSHSHGIFKKLLRKRRKLELMRERKHQPQANHKDDDQPPPLSLPSRIGKNRLYNRPLNKMPILFPECSPASLTENKENRSFRFIQISNGKENAKVKKFNGIETIQLNNSNSEDQDYNFISENEDDDDSFKGDRVRRRSLTQIKRDIHGIRRERLQIQSGTHSRDFTKSGYACMCGAKFTGAGGLYVHQVKMLEVEKFTCDKCGKRFHYFSGLKAHRKTTHKMEFTQQVGCSRCGQIFNSKKERQGHVDERGQTCWLSGSYQSKNWELIRNRRLQISNYMSR